MERRISIDELRGFAHKGQSAVTFYEERYTDNQVHWTIGTLVIHRADAKRSYMLMRIIGYDPVTGECITVYDRPPAWMSKHNQRKKWRNDIKHLLDPDKFGIEIDNADSSNPSLPDRS